VFSDATMLELPVGDVMGPPLPTIGAGEQVHVAVGRLEGAPALVVLDRGHPVGVITRSDVLATLAAGPR
jgi:cystathionine beta-synthase